MPGHWNHSNGKGDLMLSLLSIDMLLCQKNDRIVFTSLLLNHHDRCRTREVTNRIVATLFTPAPTQHYVQEEAYTTRKRMP
jgi:hypothetical protein